MGKWITFLFVVFIIFSIACSDGLESSCIPTREVINLTGGGNVEILTTSKGCGNQISFKNGSDSSLIIEIGVVRRVEETLIIVEVGSGQTYTIVDDPNFEFFKFQDSQRNLLAIVRR